MKTSNEPKENNKTGKEFELRFLHELYEHIRKKKIKCDVFQPIVDDNGIDYIIRTNNGEYREIQIKSRTKKRPFTIKTDFTRHKDYWLILYYNEDNDKNMYILNKTDIAHVIKKYGHINITKELEQYKTDTGDFSRLFKNK